MFWMREPNSDAFWQDWSGFKDIGFLYVFIKEVIFYIIRHFIAFFKLKKKNEAKLISMQVLNKMFLPRPHRDLPGDKGHLGATSSCKRQIPYANKWVPRAMLPPRANIKGSPSPCQACSDSRIQHCFLYRMVSMWIKPCRWGGHLCVQ